MVEVSPNIERLVKSKTYLRKVDRGVYIISIEKGKIIEGKIIRETNRKPDTQLSGISPF